MDFSRRSTSQDISWFLDLHGLGQLNLDPPYQRKSVWSPKDRRFYLDTIFNGYPCPAVFIDKDIVDGKACYAVIDGKQRLETIFRFYDNEIKIGADFTDTRLAGKKFEDLSDDLQKKFYNYVLPVEFISIDDNGERVNQIFDRLNRNSRKLTSQELRHAKYDGWFIGFVEKEAEQEEEWRAFNIVTITKSKRMQDVQNISELLMVVLAKNVLGFKQDHLDKFCADYDDPFTDLVDDFDEDEVVTKFNSTKAFLLSLETSDQMVTRYAKNFKDFYVLWAYLAFLDKLPDSNVFKKKYEAFMTKVAEYQVDTGSGDFPDSVKMYYENSRGASTDFKPRNNRYLALKQFMEE